MIGTLELNACLTLLFFMLAGEAAIAANGSSSCSWQWAAWCPID
jgi:hypothetical protein